MSAKLHLAVMMVKHYRLMIELLHILMEQAFEKYVKQRY